MSFFKIRSDYFRELANKNKLISHDRFVQGNSGPKRASFHRINDEQELMDACVNWAHFPCLVHAGYIGRYSERTNEVKKRKVTNTIIVLDKAAGITPDAREIAYDNSFLILEEIVSKLVYEWEHYGYCANIQKVDLSLLGFQMIGPIGDMLFGWQLDFPDEQMSEDLLKYDSSKWYED